jgi:serine/threonine protein phosphatase PrpC
MIEPSVKEAWQVLGEWGVAALTTKGCKDSQDSTIGQDNLSVSRLSNDWEVFCVMDGHGTDGHWPASRAVRTIPYFLQNLPSSALLCKGQVREALVQAFEEAEKDLEWYNENKDPTLGSLELAGTTGACVLRNPTDPETLWVATVGDTRVVLMMPGQGVVEKTIDHSPKISAEAIRIVKNGGEIKTREFDDGYVDIRIVVEGTNTPGIAMTRSLGDLVAKEIGVIAEPEVLTWSTKGRDEAYLFIACDGIWEFMSEDDVADIVFWSLAQGATCEEVLAQLLEKARELWKKNEGAYCDDITAILFPVNSAPAPILASKPQSTSWFQSFFSRFYCCAARETEMHVP